MVLCPGIEVKTVEGNALIADGYFGEIRANFGVEAVAVHAQIERCIAQPNQAGQEDGHRSG